MPRPAPIIRLVGLSISGIPGPPFGPRYRRTTTVFSPFLIDPLSTAFVKSSSVLKVRAFPVKPRPSLPVILATAPPGARLPFRILKCDDCIREKKANYGEKHESQPKMSGFFDGFVEWPDDILTVGQFSVFVYPSFEILAYRAASNSHIVPINAVVLE